jgi:hypothetical protein
MNAERNNDPALKPQLCPRCAQPMRLARWAQRFGGLPELVTLNANMRPVPYRGTRAAKKFGNPTREIKSRGSGL